MELQNLYLDSVHFARTADILKLILSVGGGTGFCEPRILPAPICRDENRTKIVAFDETTQWYIAPLSDRCAYNWKSSVSSILSVTDSHIHWETRGDMGHEAKWYFEARS
jgi:hypothetical protein